MLDGTGLIVLERARQITHEGYTPAGDARWDNKELAKAAQAYLVNEPRLWPFDGGLFKTDMTCKQRLVKAGALIAAEIDRLQRKEEEDDRARSGGIVHKALECEGTGPTAAEPSGATAETGTDCGSVSAVSCEGCGLHDGQGGSGADAQVAQAGHTS